MNWLQQTGLHVLSRKLLSETGYLCFLYICCDFVRLLTRLRPSLVGDISISVWLHGYNKGHTKINNSLHLFLKQIFAWDILDSWRLRNGLSLLPVSCISNGYLHRIFPGITSYFMEMNSIKSECHNYAFTTWPPPFILCTSLPFIPVKVSTVGGRF